IDDAALEEQYKNLADEHKMDVEKVKGIIPADSLKADLAAEKAFELVKANADITEVEAKAE
ncbi:MAG: trigger factor, partial [Oscillospiraceae bacterium]|nr:trigger factor [Oscillospiraceae bacterium]